MALSKFGKFAKTMFQKHPLITNSFVYGVLYVGAEFSQQTLTRKVLVTTFINIIYIVLSFVH